MTAAAPMRPGPWIVRTLEAYGVDTVFGIPGVHTIELYRGLAGSGIRHVTPRHEQGAAFMADGYARTSGKPGVCFLITGPGLTNAVTAMAQAHADSIPMLVITGVSARRHLGHGRGRLHELPDQRRLAETVTAFSHTLQDLEDLPAVLDRAFAVFRSARPRPVHIEIPLDLWNAEAAPDAVPTAPRPAVPPLPSPDSLDEAARLLSAARRPVILTGGGARHAAEPLRAVAEALDAPVVMTVNGRGLLPPGHPLAVPASPSLAAVRSLVAGSDAVLAVGTEIGPTDYDMYETGMGAFGTPVVRIDIDAEQLTRGLRADLPMLGDARETLTALAGRLPKDTAEEGGASRAAEARAAARAELDPNMQAALAVIEALREAAPEAVIVGDSTQPVYAGNLYFAASKPGGWFNSATGYGTLGYALPAAVGASLGRGNAPTLCLIGDGGLQFTLGELGSLAEAEAPVAVVVWDNTGYGEIKSAMIASGVETVGVDLLTPDITAIARAYGLAAYTPESPAALAETVKAALGTGKPAVIVVREADML